MGWWDEPKSRHAYELYLISGLVTSSAAGAGFTIYAVLEYCAK